MNEYAIPKATLGRLPQYLQYLKSLPQGEGATISATAIARELSLGEVLVRKDLAAVSGAGKPKIGYDQKTLVGQIERHLGYDGLTGAVIVGAGKLGKALLGYDGFEEFGVKIVAGFDRSPEAIGPNGGVKQILPMEELERYCSENSIRLGIITVGFCAAQEVCDRLVASGVEAIWNFAPCQLKVPAGVLLQQENLALSLAYLNNQIKK